MAGVILGIGRAIGEATAVMMVVGNRTSMPKGLLKGVRTLTSNIVMEMGYAVDLHREALIATAVVLFVFILIINVLTSILKRRSGKARRVRAIVRNRLTKPTPKFIFGDGRERRNS